MTTQNNMATLQNHLFEVLQAVKTGDIDVERANAVCAVSQQLINTVKVESEFARNTGLAVSSSLIEVKSPPATLLPPPPAKKAEASDDHERRVLKTGVLERNGAVTRHTMR